MTADIDTLRAELVSRFEPLCETLVGEAPNRTLSTRRTLRFYAKGGLSVEVAGHKRGTWFSHSAGEGGGPFQLIQHLRRCTIGEAIEWAREWTGQPRQAATPRPAPQPAQIGAEEAAERAQRIAAARRLWAGASAIAGTVAAVYLTGARAIPAPAVGWPDAVRFHEPSRSLILAATTDSGELQAVQRIRLTPDARKADGSAHAPTKQTNGVLAGAAVRLPGDAAGPLLLAEGPETGLSVWAATENETWIALGSIANTTPPAGRRIVICRDDDKLWSPADRKLRDTLTAWRDAGADVVVATPWPQRRQDASDFNDTIKSGGADAVRARIAAALTPAGATRPRLPVTEARGVLDAAIAAFFASAAAHDPGGDAPAPVQAIRVDVGVGKSTFARQRAADMLAAMRERGDKRTVVIAVPTHRLGDEQARAFEALPVARAANLTAAVWRGRERDDPDAAGETMCRDLDRIKDANEALVAVQSAVCKRKNPENGSNILCPLFHQCGYQRQLERGADVWIVAHELLFTQKPAAIGEVAACIVDESAWQDGLQGASGADMVLSLDALRATDEVPFDPAGTFLLNHLRRSAFEALTAQPDGPVSRTTMLNAPLPAASAAEAYRLEWMRKVDPGMHPGMSARERKEAVKTAARNKTVARLGMFWRAVEALTKDDGPEASGWASLGWNETKDGPVRVLALKARKPVREGWHAPTMLIDATLNIDLVRYHWPRAALVADLAVEAPHQRIRQVTDSSFSKRRLIPWEGSTPEVLRAGTRNLRDLHAALAAIGRQRAPGRVLAVVQIGVEDALPALGRLPPNVETAHHNAIAGRDGWRDVAALVVVGRTAPKPAAVERIAEALTGAAVTPLAGWYERACGGREMRDGTPLEAEADCHPDPIAEAIRWHICEGEIVQIIGRARGVNRTAADPVDVLVLTDLPLPLPLDGTLVAADLSPTPADLMLAAGGIAFENPTDAVEAYPSLWPTREAAKKSLHRLGTNPYNKTSYTGLSPTCARRVDYQRMGTGTKPAVAWCDPHLAREPAGAITVRLGRLAWCQPAPAIEQTVAHAPDVEMVASVIAVPVQGRRIPAGCTRLRVADIASADFILADLRLGDPMPASPLPRATFDALEKRLLKAWREPIPVNALWCVPELQMQFSVAREQAA